MVRSALTPPRLLHLTANTSSEQPGATTSQWGRQIAARLVTNFFKLTRFERKLLCRKCKSTRTREHNRGLVACRSSPVTLLRKVNAQPDADGGDPGEERNENWAASARHFFDPKQDVTDEQIK